MVRPAGVLPSVFGAVLCRNRSYSIHCAPVLGSFPLLYSPFLRCFAFWGVYLAFFVAFCVWSGIRSAFVFSCDFGLVLGLLSVRGRAYPLPYFTRGKGGADYPPHLRKKIFYNLGGKIG